MIDSIKIALGFMAGAGAGIIGTKRYFEEKYKKIADEEIEAIREWYMDDIENKEAGDISEDLADSTDEEDISEEPESESEEIEFSTPDKPSIDEVHYNVFDSVPQYPEDDIPDEPYRITYEEFAEEHTEHDKIDLVFYTDDGYLIDNEDNVVELSGSIGAGAFDDLMYGDESELYYRNEKFGEDYQVTRIKSSYVDYIPDETDEDLETAY